MVAHGNFPFRDVCLLSTALSIGKGGAGVVYEHQRGMFTSGRRGESLKQYQIIILSVNIKDGEIHRIVFNSNHSSIEIFRTDAEHHVDCQHQKVLLPHSPTVLCGIEVQCYSLSCRLISIFDRYVWDSLALRDKTVSHRRVLTRRVAKNAKL